MTRRDARLLARLKAHAAIIRPQLVRRFGLHPADASSEPCPACDATGRLGRLDPRTSRASRREQRVLGSSSSIAHPADYHPVFSAAARILSKTDSGLRFKPQR